MSNEHSSTASLLCKYKYKVRSFYSKGAFLVLLWSTLKGVTLASSISIFHSLHRSTQYHYPNWLAVFPIAFSLLGAIVSGWLADAKLGNYKIFKGGLILQFFTSLCFSIYTLFPPSFLNKYIISVMYCLGGSLFLIGVTASIITSLQLGLDQMPAASSSSIASFIVWLVFSLAAGTWLGNIITFSCVYDSVHDSVQVLSLIPIACVSIALISDFLLAKKCLIIEPESPQSLKTMYQIVKFAAKHKAPLNRSALTYWEEKVPSRMDLGKSRFGGPFTTEQVEDVKTIFRLLVLSLSLFIISFSLGVNPTISVFFSPPNLNYCYSFVLSLFTYNSWWCGVVDTLIHEFILYPITRHINVSIIKRIGIVSFIVTTISIVFLILEILHHFLILNDYVTNSILTVLYAFSRGWLLRLLVCAIVELICAQAPYNMRGLFAGCVVFIFTLSFSTGESFILFPMTTRMQLCGIKVGISLFGFILYCLLARWYKKRVRDEEYCVQRGVEEVYDRYLSAQTFVSN